MAQVNLEGEECLALLDSGSQVNTITLQYVEARDLKVFTIEELPVSLVRIGGVKMGPLGFFMLETCVVGVGGYSEDHVFLVVPDTGELCAHHTGYIYHWKGNKCHQRK